MTDYLRVSILGELPSGEKWSINPHFITDTAGADWTYTQLNTACNAIANIDPPATVKVYWSGTTKLTGARIEARQLDGTLENVVEKVADTPRPGTGTVGHPFQSAAVLSLRTATPGASGRGRLYLPATGVALDLSSLRISGIVPANLLIGMQTYLSGILTALRAQKPATSLAVYSRKNSQLNLVNAISAGDIVDTQRRRRDTLVENYVTASFVN